MYGSSLLWAEFAMGRVCFVPTCPVTAMNAVGTDVVSVHK